MSPTPADILVDNNFNPYIRNTCKMPTRISAGVGDTLVSLLFNTMIPIDYKITNFSI